MNNINHIKGRFICLFFVLTVLVSCKQNDVVYKHNASGNALGTTYHITYLGDEIDSLLTKIDSITDVVNHSLSTYQSNSFITAFNTNSRTLWQNEEEASYMRSDIHHFVEMVNLSKTISAETNGAFDPTAAALFAIYDHAKREGIYMDTVQVNACMEHQGMEKMYSTERGLPYKMDSLVSLNFNAIAKGYLVDLVAEYLDTRGVTNYMVEIGGELRVRGKNAESLPWKVGVNMPIVGAGPTDFFKVLELEDVAMATSGNYQNYYTVGGRLVGHTLDPRTGQPVISNLKSATILHDYCAVADAYATACMVVGLDKATKWIEGNKSLSAYFIYEEEGELKGVFVE